MGSSISIALSARLKHREPFPDYIARILFGASLVLAGCSADEPAAPAFERFAPEGLAESQKLWNYSQVIVTSPGAQMVEVAGTTGDDENGDIVGPGDSGAQTKRAFANVETSLRAAGTTSKDATRVRMYVMSLDAEGHWPIVNALMRKHFGDQAPAATMIGVQALATPDILFEIDATAAIPAGRAGPGTGERP